MDKLVCMKLHPLVSRRRRQATRTRLGFIKTLLSFIKAFYRSFNAIYGHVGKTASEDVILSLVKSKCLPVLLYGLDVCPLTVTDRRSFDFTVTRILMKIFKTNNIDVIDECRQYFAFHTVEHLIKVRKSRFLRKYANENNIFCKIFSTDAEIELNELSR